MPIVLFNSGEFVGSFENTEDVARHLIQEGLPKALFFPKEGKIWGWEYLPVYFDWKEKHYTVKEISQEKLREKLIEIESSKRDENIRRRTAYKNVQFFPTESVSENLDREEEKKEDDKRRDWEIKDYMGGSEYFGWEWGN